MSDATAHNFLQSPTLPLICSNEGAMLFVIFFFPHSFLLQGMHVGIYPGKNKKKKNKHWIRTEKNNTTVPTELLLVSYTAWSFKKHRIM